MRGCTLGFGRLVNADIGSMGVIDHKGGVPTDLPPQLAVIKDTTSKLKQHYVSYEEAKRQLDFLEKGGDPLDFRDGNASSLSVQSTTLIDQRHDQLGTSKVKDRLGVVASPPGDSVESSGRPHAPLGNEPNCDDNLMLFHGNNDFLKGERNSTHSPRRIIGQFEKSFRLGGIENSKESGDSAAYELRGKSSRRRNRSRSSRDGTRSSSTDIVSSRGVHTYLPSQNATRDANGLVINEDNQKDYDVCLKSILRSTSPNYNSAPKNKTLNRFEVAGGVQSLHSNVDVARGGLPDANASNSLLDNQNQYSESGLWITPVNKAQSEESQEVHERADLAGHKCASSLGKPKVEDQVTFAQMNRIISIKGEKMSALNEHQNGNAVRGTRGLDSESSCNQTSLIIERNFDSKICANIRISCSNGNDNQEIVAFEDMPYKEGNKLVKETDMAKVKETCDITNDENDYFREQENGSILRNKQVLNEKVSGSLIEMKDRVPTVGVVPDASTAQENKRLPNNLLGSSFIGVNGNACTSKLQVITESSIQETLDTKLCPRVCAVLPERQSCPHVTSKLATKECEDLILEEARMIESQCKRITDISVHTLPLEVRRISHWEFVLEEMAWLANDFAQERIWKISAAALIGYEASAAFQFKSHEQKSRGRQKEVAHNLAEAVVNFWRGIEETSRDQNLHRPGKDFSHAIQGYALNFLEYNTCTVQPAQAESPMTPDRISDDGILDMSWDTYLKEENLFYSVPTGAMEAYRKSVVSHFLQFEKTGSRKEEVETTCYDTLAVNVKRCADMLNVSIPTKRVRTASRQRVPSHYNAETSGCVQAPIKTDASSGDTTSFQDDQSTLYGGLHTLNTLEVESLRDFDKQTLYDSAEILHKPKKKEAKIMDSTYEQRWQMNSSYQNEQRENNKRRLDNHQLESNGSNGLYVQQVVKKPKIMKQLRNNSVNILHLAGRSVPSPVASQMSNMSNPNKLIKMLGGRERGRKSKTVKAPAGQPGLGSQWSLFEDQALIVLVHDMGPNWEFVSDAIGSTSQLKCIFRKPKDCKERHKILMDSPAGDGADSAEDSGSSQPYRSTLPGIPKGSARQLFQHLQGPMEDTTIKFHLEKIIILGKKQHCRTKEPKQLQVPHNSHTFALSQVCPNNINGGPVLTPLDLCDATTSCSDVLSLDYQSSHNSLLPISTQGVAPTLPTSGATSSIQASSDLALSSNFSSPGPLNTSVRFGIPRSASVSIDEQQPDQLLSNRNIQQPSMPVHGVQADHSVCMLMSGSGVGDVSGLSKTIHMVSPGVHEIASSSMLNSDNLLSPGMVAMPSPVNIQSGLHTGPGNCMMRPRDSLHMMQPTRNLDHQRQMMIPELHMQVSQGSTKGVSPIGGSSSSPNQTTHPLHHSPHPLSSHQSHALGNFHIPHLQKSNQTSTTHHQVCVSRLAREKHIQQQRLLQQQYATSCALTPAVQGQSQLPLSSPQDFSQFQTQTSSPPVTLSPMTPFSKHSQRHQIPPHGAGRNPQVGSGLTNQTGKQRQRQPQQQQFHQAVRHHPQLREQSRSQQQAKTINSIGRGPKEHALVNGLSTNSGSQSEEKGELDLHTMQLVTTSHHALPQQEMYSVQFHPHSNTDNSNQNHVVSTMAATVQTVASPVVPAFEQQQSLLAQPQLHAEPNSNIVDQTHANLKNIPDWNCQVNANPPKKKQNVKAQSDLSPVNNYSTQMGTSTSVPGCVEAAYANSVVSAEVTQWKAPETESDSHIPNKAELCYIVSSSLTSSGGEPGPLPFPSQGLVQRQSSVSLPPVQRLQKQSQLQPSILLPPIKQKQEESQKQLKRSEK